MARAVDGEYGQQGKHLPHAAVLGCRQQRACMCRSERERRHVLTERGQLAAPTERPWLVPGSEGQGRGRGYGQGQGWGGGYG